MPELTKERIAEIAKEVAVEVLREKEVGAADPGKAYEDMVRAITAAHQAPVVAQPPAKGLVAGRIIRCLAAGKGDPERALKFATSKFGEDDLATKALSAGTDSEGGYSVPEIWSTELIELLQAQAVVRSLNPTIYDMPSGTLHVPKLATGATATYIAENANIVKTQQVFGELVLNWHKLAALIPVSNDLIRQSNQNIDAVIRDDIVSSLALREDLAFIRDDGSGQLPTGLLNLIASGNIFDANGTVNLANVTDDLAACILKLRNANVRFLRPGWMFSPRTEMYLRTIRDGNGNYAFKDEMDAGRLFGYPFGVTTQIPWNLGTGTNESEVYFCDFADVVIGQLMTIRIDVSETAAYHDGSNVVASFSLDQTVIRAIMEHDIGLRHDLSGSVIEAVLWGV
jgi:HK97 family phage major capsid protein